MAERRVTRLLPPAAGVLAGLAILALGVAWAADLYAPYYVLRVALFYPLTLLALAAWIAGAAARPQAPAAGPGRRRPAAFDLLDLAIALFAAWQVVAALAAPVAVTAWFGAYNRLGGALFWLALAALAVLARRLAADPRTLDALLWPVAALPVLAGGAALAQALGAAPVWPAGHWALGRAVGTTGNPVTLAGLCLIVVWLGALAATSVLPRALKWWCALGCALGLVGLVLAVSRAAYASLLVGALVLATVWAVRGERRRLAGLAGVAAAVLLATFLYTPGPGWFGGALFERVHNQASAPGVKLGQLDAGRVAFWKVALRGVRHRPVTGYGPGSYIVAYRRFATGTTAQDRPMSAVTDAHSLPLGMAVESGLPGLLLALAVAGVAGLALWRAMRGDGWRRAAAREGAGDPVVAEQATAAAAFAAAAVAFLTVSPTEPALLAALVAAIGVGVGAPVPQGAARTVRGGVWTLGPSRRLVWARAAAMAACLLGAAIAAALGVQLVRADAALDAAVAAAGSAGRATPASLSAADDARRAVDLMPWVPVYSQTAGRMLASTGRADPAVLGQAASLLQKSLRLDPTQPGPHVDLAKLALRRGDVPGAMTQIAAGLAADPHHPVLQGLWGYAAVSALKDGHDRTLATSLRDGLAALPGKTADGWYWLAAADVALGDVPAGRTALQQAKGLAPDFTTQTYDDRLRIGE